MQVANAVRFASAEFQNSTKIAVGLLVTMLMLIVRF